MFLLALQIQGTDVKYEKNTVYNVSQKMLDPLKLSAKTLSKTGQCFNPPLSPTHAHKTMNNNNRTTSVKHTY